MTKEEIKAIIEKKNKRMNDLKESIKNAKEATEIRSLYEEADTLKTDIANYRSIMDSMPEDNIPPEAQEQRSKEIEAEQRKKAPTGEQFNPLATYQVGNGAASEKSDKRSIDDILKMPTGSETERAQMRSELFKAPEYRSGYFKALAGRKDFTDVEKRALTTAADSGGAAVPTTTYDMILKRMTQTSALFGLINKTQIPGNVVLPVANAQNAAKWSDTAPDPDEDDTLTQVSLSAYALSKFAKVKGQLILMSIDALETYVVSAISDQLAIAVENAILNGTGADHSQPTGIFTGVTWTTANAKTYSTNVGYDDLVDAKKLLGLYRANAVWVVNAAMEAQIYKIKTSVNQPLFTQNPITGLISNPLGFQMVVDYYMPDDTILLFNPNYYYMNINQNPTITADDSAGFLSTSRVYRGTMYLDAKPALSEAFVKLTKAA